MRELYSAIPAMDLCLRALREESPQIAKAPQALLKEIVAAYWDEVREKIRDGALIIPEFLSLEYRLAELREYALKRLRPNLRRVLNGAGVIIHTNLGRSILAREAAEAAMMAAGNYCSLEMDLASGERGSRHSVTEDMLKKVTGAEAALVVNNNAAAVLLILDTLCRNGEAIVSRGELVEIGGSFRIPDIMAKSGAILREVGTTNRTHLRDYREAINENTKAIMRVHTSNFRVIGFHSAVDLPELKALAHEHRLPLIFDLGSGNLLDFTAQGLPYEPTVAEVIKGGADCVSFSGDKALGGPQAGIIAGKKSLVDQFKKNPLTRALRCDKLCLAALEATLRLYLEPETARENIPTPRMMSMSPKELAAAARVLAARIRRALDKEGIACGIRLARDFSRVGGGTYPECGLPTSLVCLSPANCSPLELKKHLLETDPPLIGRLENEAFCLDPRTLEKGHFGEAAELVAQALKACRK